MMLIDVDIRLTRQYACQPLHAVNNVSKTDSSYSGCFHNAKKTELLDTKLDRMTRRSCSFLSTVCMHMYQKFMRVNMLIVCSVNPQSDRLEIVTRRGTIIAAGYPQPADESNTAYV